MNHTRIMKCTFETMRRTWFLRTLVLSFVITVGNVAYAQVPLPVIKQAQQRIEADQPKKGVTLLKDAITANPTDASLWYYLGEAQIITGDKKAAEISFQTGLEKNDKEALNLVGKGHLRLLDNQVAEAKKLFEQALTLTKSKNTAVLNEIAKAYLLDVKYANDALNLLQKIGRAHV